MRFLCPLLCALGLHAQPPSATEIRGAVDRAMPVVQQASAKFYQSQACNSCHHLSLPMLTYAVARERGIRVDEAIAATTAQRGLASTTDLTSFDRAVQNVNVIDTVASDGWAVIAASSIGYGKSLTTGIYTRRIASHQRADGHFRTGDARPPQSYGDFYATATAVRVMATSMPDQLAAEKTDRLARARKWLLTAKPATTEDYTSRLVGLTYAGATAAERTPAVNELAALQRQNGGWAQLPHLEPDAYSTGEALVALNEAGIAATDPRYVKGLRYLLQSRDDRGIWHVRTRMTSPAQVSPPYLDTGFPYAHDQFLSMDGTCWSMMALMKALPKAEHPAAAQKIAAFADQSPQPWMTTAALGTAAALKTLLDKGLNPNSKTPDGTTVLMAASHDPEMTKLLIARGTDVAEKAKTNFTALMVAAGYYANAESVKALLAHGAEARPGTGVFFNGSPLTMAIYSGDTDTIAQLLAKGADPNRKMNLIGMFPSSPLMSAIGFGDTDTIKLLAKAGAKVDERDPDQMTLLHWAVVANHTDTAKALIAAGVSPNAVDKNGYTPLHYASAIDFGNADTVKALIASGADRAIKTKEGKTAKQTAAATYLAEAVR